MSTTTLRSPLPGERTPSKSLPRIVLRSPESSGDSLALSSDPDWDGPPIRSRAVKIRSARNGEHPATKADFEKLEECGSILARNLGWGPLNGVAIREAGQIAAQRYGYSAGKDATLAEEAFSLLLSAL